MGEKKVDRVGVKESNAVKEGEMQNEIERVSKRKGRRREKNEDVKERKDIKK